MKNTDHAFSFRFWHWVFFLGMLLTFNPQPGVASPASEFDKGKSYFKQGQYQKAIQAFERARKQGLNSPALHYNRGVTYFKLKQYDKAESAFKKVLRSDKLKSLAEYNLGLVARKQGDKQAARNWFNKSARSRNEKIAGLSRLQLAKLSPKKPARRPEKKWFGYASASYGHNDNIKLAPLEVALNASDSYLDLYASATGVLSGSYNDGLLLDAFVYILNYTDVDSYDEKQARAGLYKSARLAGWRSRIGAYYERSTFGSTDYQQILGLEARAKRRLDKTNSIALRYRYDNLDSLDSTYDYLNGWRQQFRVELMKYTPQHSGRIYYELELNDRQNLVRTTTSGTNYYNYSPTRHKFLGIYRYNLTRNWRIGAELSYRFSKYVPTPTQNRQDDRLRGALEARYRINKMWRVKGRYQRTDNDSTENRYDYVQNIYYVTVEALF